MKSELNVTRKTAYFYSLAYLLVIIFSLTFAFPWAFSRYHGWLINNTRINNRKLTFNGKTKHLYLIYFTGIFFAVITFSAFTFLTALISVLLDRNGIEPVYFKDLVFKFYGTIPTLFFAIFITSRFYKYRTVHTHFEDTTDGKSGIRLEIYKIILSSIIFKVIFVLTNIIGYPFAMNIRERFLVSRKFIDNNKLKLKGNLGRICLIWYLGLVLSVLTLTLYVPYLFFQLNRYIIVNSVLRYNKREFIHICSV